MHGFLEILLVTAVIWSLMFWRASRYLWTGAMGIYLLYASLAHPLPAGVLAIAWVVFLLVTVVVLVPVLRMRWITGPLLHRFNAIMPSVSATEREALEAGTVWWEAELFSGQPDWRRMLSFPRPGLSTEEQAFLDGPVEELCSMLNDWEITEELRDLPADVWQFIKDNGFFGMIIPKRYGGLEFSAHGHSSVVMKIASRSLTAGVTVMVPNSLGPAKLLLHYGTQEQKAHYLPRLAKGREVPCFALTGPEAGSDAASMPDNGIVCTGEFGGKSGVLGIRLNWEKRYITLGPVATVLGLAFHLQDPDHLLGEEEDIGITLALIPTDTRGVEIGNRHFPLNHAFQNGPTRGRDVFIPMDWIIGGKEHAGQGWRMLMECLSDGRAISLPALSTASGKMMSRVSGAYAAVRKQFKMPIGKFEGIAEVLARIGGISYVMNAARGFTTAALDSGENPSVASAIVKYHLTEYMRTVVNLAMDIHGGRGICLGPSNYVARGYQALPIGITVEGANILTRSLIIFGQGAIRCHPCLLREMQAAREQDVEAFDAALFEHAALITGNAARSLFHALTAGRFITAPDQGPSAGYFREFTRMSLAFSVTAEAALLSLGGALKRRESLSSRLADALSYLYLGSAVLKHFRDQDCPADDQPFVQWACDELLYRTQEALNGVLDNFPGRVQAAVVRRLIFPYGRCYRAPSDALGGKISALLQQSGPVRERLTAGIYIPSDIAQPVRMLEDAFEKAKAALPVERKLTQAMRDGVLITGNPEEHIDDGVKAGIITDREARMLYSAIAARKRVIQVDEFTPQQLAREDVQWNNGKPMKDVAGQSL